MKRKAVMTVVALAALGVTFAAGRSSRPARLETREAVQWRERKVYLRREIKVADVRTASYKATRVLRLPDGTLSRETTETTGSVSSASMTRTSGSVSELQASVAKTSVAAVAEPKWSLGMIGGFDLTLKRQPWAGVYLSRQVLGPISAGLFAGTGGNVGFTLGIRF